MNLKGMTQARWERMTRATREAARDLGGLSPQLTGLEGWRVEVETSYGDRRRFIVSRSTGWRPCHIEVPRRDSSGGISCDNLYKNVRKLYKARGK